jgi:drug/metabolite transporter (DMT)-like permease
MSAGENHGDQGDGAVSTGELALGVGLLLLSALLFAVTTVGVKLATQSGPITARTVTFARFAVGFLLVAPYVWLRRVSLVPKSPRWVLMRAVFNALAVSLFFAGIQLTTVSKANLLNMTYPVFVFLFAPFMNREQSPPRYYLYLLLTMIGVVLVMAPRQGMALEAVNAGDFLAFGSALVAGLAISALRQSRKHDGSLLILFYVMSVGSVVTFLLMLPGFRMPGAVAASYAVGAAVAALLGQVCLTVGYRYISAAGGALVSASRIVFAIALGVMLLGDPLTLRTIAGATLIILSLLGVSGVLRLRGYKSRR